MVGGVATLSTTTLAVGTHTLSAGYPGDANNAASTSNAVSQVIDAAQVGLPPAIPTLDAFGLLVLAALLAVAAAAQSRRR